MSRRVTVELTVPQASAILVALTETVSGEGEGWTNRGWAVLNRGRDALIDAYTAATRKAPGEGTGT
jgi:hypothetical protein